MIHFLYRTLTIAGGPLIGLYLDRRMARGKEDRERFHERLGHSAHPRPAGPLVWLHAASVGESLSLLPLIDALSQRPGLSLLVTTGTVTSAHLLADRLPAGVLHQYIPVDRPAWVRRFFDHWKPDLGLWAESDFWPNLLTEASHRKLPLVLIQGRISPRSFDGWQRVPTFIRRLLSSFSLCLAQTETDARRLRQLGAHDVRCLGNLKLSVPPLPYDEAEAERLHGLTAHRKVWLASSTHAGEEAMAGRIHRSLNGTHGDLLTIIVPRHSTRGGEIERELTGLGLNVALRSRGEEPDPNIDVYIADTMGDLGLFYRLAPVVFMGKSLLSEGGQNPYEPARLGAAVLFGPRMSNFPDMTPSMLAAGAAEQVSDEIALAETVGKLLGDPAEVVRRRQAALTWADSEAGALETVISALAPFLTPLAETEALHARP